MRFLSLTLAHYGAFTDRPLVFRRDAKLHLVYGRNEAGKSTALSAIGDLLYGFPKSSPFGFKHRLAELLLEAELATGGGETMAMLRRKRVKGALTLTDGTVLDEDALRPFIGGLEREHFQKSFGLTAQWLRRGADELLERDSRDGTSLFAASSGLHGVKTLIERLDAEASALRGMRSDADKPFNVAVRRGEEAITALRIAVQQSSRWLELDRAITAEQAALDALEPRLRVASRTIGQLTKLQHAHEAIAKANAELVTAQAAMAEASHALEACPPADPVLRHGGEVAALRNNSAYRGFVKDLPGVADQVRQHNAALAGLGRALGVTADELQQRQPSDAAIARVKRLAAEGQKRDQQLQDLDTRSDRKTAELAALAEPAGARVLVDPAHFRLRYEALGGELSDIARRPELANAIARDAAQLARRAAALNPPVKDAEEIARLPLPSPETVGRYKTLSSEIGARRNEARAALARAEEAERAAAAALRQLAAGGEPITGGQVKAARAARDGLWRRLARHLAGAETLAAPDAATVSVQLTAAIAEADRLADLAAAETERAAKVELQRNVMADAEARRGLAGQQLAGAEREIKETQAEWQREWRPTGISPRSAAEMADWLSDLNGLRHEVIRLTAARADLASLEARAGSLLPILASLASAMGMRHAASDASLTGVEIARQLAALEDEWRARRDAQRDRDRVELEIATLAKQRDEVARAGAEWRSAWSEALEALGLAGGCSFAEATAAWEAWGKVPAALAQREEAQHRVNGMKRDITAFEERVQALVSALAPAHEPVTNAFFEAESLAARFDAAAKAEQARANSERDLLERRKALAAAGAALDVARANHAALAQSLGDDPHPDDITLKLAGLEEEQSRLMVETSQRAPVLRDLKAQRMAMEESLAAETAMGEVKAAEANALLLAREWIVAKLAGRLVTESVKRHRSAAEGRLLSRASEHFATLTGARFRGLEMDFGEGDISMLMACRDDGERIAVARLANATAEGLSEGTRDQVYLALRLAFLEDYASRAEPLPFIGDDIFVSFDDERTGHALVALAGIADRLQPIVFTHHRAVVDIARARLGGAVDVIEL